jgi:hypothetical protein
MTRALKTGILIRVSKALTEAGIVHAVGGSAMLHLKGIVSTYGDIDIVVRVMDKDIIETVMGRLAGRVASPVDPAYGTCVFMTYELEGCRIEIIGGYHVRSDPMGRTYVFDTHMIERHVTMDGVSVPLAYLSDWETWYALIGRDSRVSEIRQAIDRGLS